MRLYRTDLAVEAAAEFKQRLPHGVSMQEQTRGSARIIRIVIDTDDAARRLGRPRVRYITIETPPVCESNGADDATHACAAELKSLLPKSGPVLVVGLGNDRITPDALGPRAARQILATRHIPRELAARTGLGALRPVAVIAPGVLGQTGIETGEIVHSVARDLSPAAVIVIDALASRSLDRLGRTIQLADSGISPGSGVFNARRELNAATLGAPVVSIGIPTVVDGETLARDILHDADDRAAAPGADAMMVTPRDIDAVIDRGAKTLSFSINAALQPQLSLEDIVYLTS